ncbi:MAG TPA: exosortase/archaeosortase family protein [Thermodesulfobacteriota bacterium]
MNGGTTQAAGAPLRTRGIGLFIAALIITAAFSPHFMRLYSLSLDSELHSYIVLIPFLSAYFFYVRRKEIAARASSGIRAGLPVLCLAAAICAAALFAWDGRPNLLLAAMVFSSVVFLMGAFVLFFGARSARSAAFPLLFLLLMVPIPEKALDPAVYLLQKGSAEVAWGLLNISGAPVQRDGFFFRLPGLSVEVAKQCSGIRSSTVLIIAGVMAAEMFLRTWPGRAALMLAVIPIAVLKNGLRITALTLGGYYIDERVLYGSLHTRGGMLFFAMALILTGGVLWGIRSIEKRRQRRKAARPC